MVYITHMSKVSHDFHFIVDFLIQNTILHETPLVELLGRKDRPMLLGGELVNRCKGPLSDLASHIVHRAA